MGMQFNVGSRVVHPCHLAYSVDNSRPALERCSIATYQVVFHIMSRVRCTGSYALVKHGYPFIFLNLKSFFFHALATNQRAHYRIALKALNLPVGALVCHISSCSCCFPITIHVQPCPISHPHAASSP
jgi:hypothetical protein